ncbi:hypothetical protein [Longimicrobium sp.]|uniref:hypothetical protein n=1 Tax=Longimicrobium sp. TaxID=2029185 RepID=UPI002C01E067|nr:hypothetical protein [Longimicrobium sp.]HSU13787.1 hypothetical protein [Longimicrobium sp.]
MALRSFTTRDGATWNVWNVVPTLGHKDRRVSLSVGMTDGWLCFECAGIKRRIVPTPSDWEGWSDEQLETALTEASLVERRGA